MTWNLEYQAPWNYKVDIKMIIEYHCYQPLLIGLPSKSNHKWCCSKTLFFRVTPLPAVKSEGSWIGFPTHVIFLLVTVTGRLSILNHAETASKALSKYSPSPLLWTETPWQHNLLKRHRKYDNKHQHPKNSDYPHSHQRSIEWPAFWHIIWWLKPGDHQPGCIRSHPNQLSTGAQFWPSKKYIKVKDQRKGLSKSILVGLVPSIFDMLTNAYIEGLLVSSYFNCIWLIGSSQILQPQRMATAIPVALFHHNDPAL